MGSSAQIVCDTLVTVAFIVGYIALTVTGHDGTAFLGLLAGWIGRAGVGAALTKSQGS